MAKYIDAEKTYQGWQSGEFTAQEALDLMCQFLGRIQDEVDPLEKTEKQLRAWSSEIVDYLGGKAEVSNFGKLEITSPSISYSYDKKLVDQLTYELRTEGHGDLAARLDACLKVTNKAGSLRVTRSKGA